MNALEATVRLNGAAKHWTLTVGRNGLDVRFAVSGEVLPPGRLRGARPFFGPPFEDARSALIAGAQEMERVWGLPS